MPTAEAVAAALAERRSKLQSLAGRASVQRRGAAGRERVVVRMWAQRPRSVRFEAVGPMNQTLGVLVAKGKSFGLYIAQENRYLHGPATAENLGRLFGLALAPEQLVEILLGGVPVAGEGRGRVEWDGELGLVHYQPDDADGLELWLDPGALTVNRLVQRDAADRTVHELTARAFESHDGVPLPRRISFERRSPVEEVVTVKVRKVRVNVKFEGADPFTYQPPEGTLREWVN